MAFNDNYGNNKQNYGGSKGSNGFRGKSNFNKNFSNEAEIHYIDQPLHIYYQDKASFYLPNGKAYSYAKQFSRIKSHQLRKILSQSKSCRDELGTMDFKQVQAHLFALLPLSAYNAGRDKSLKVLYVFLAEHLNQKSIVSEEDVQVFDELFTSVIAYHKFLGEGK